MYRKIHLRTNPYLIKDGKYYPRLETISILTLRKTNAASAIMALAQLKVLRLLISILSMSHQIESCQKSMNQTIVLEWRKS